MSEATEQQAVVEWCGWNGIPVFAIPNGGRRNAKEAYFLRKSGVKAGVPDLFVPVPKGGFSGLFIELKVGRNTATETQKQWLELLGGNGYRAEVCRGARAAIELISEYIGEADI